MGKKEELYEKQHIIKKKMIILNYIFLSRCSGVSSVKEMIIRDPLRQTKITCSK